MNEPGYITNFIKLDELTDNNRKHLTNIGVSLDWLDGLRQQNFNPPVESDLWAGFPPSDTDAIVNEISLSSICPFSGKTRRSYHGFCPPISEAIFYLFRGEPEYFIILSGGNNILTGLYVPFYGTLVSFMNYKRESVGGVENNMNNSEFDLSRFEEWIRLLDDAGQRHEEEIKYYLSAKSNSIGIIFGFKNHLSYHVRDEINLLNHLVENTSNPGKIPVLCGPHDFFDIASLYPELNIIKLDHGLEALDNTDRDKDWQNAYSKVHQRMFAEVARNKLLPTRSIYRRKYIPNNLKDRILRLSDLRCSPAFNEQVMVSRENKPLIWVTIRNHNRIWLGQEDGLAKVLDGLYEEYPNMGVVFDGYYSTLPLMNKIITKFKQPIQTFSALNCSLFETVKWCKASDFFISAVGDGMIFLAICGAKYGVLHSHQAYAERDYFFPYGDEQRQNMPCIGGEFVQNNSHFEADYTLDWKLLLEKALVASKQSTRAATEPF